MTAAEFKQLREAADMTQFETALLLLVAERTISAWETAANEIPKRKVEWIRSALRSAAKNRKREAK